MAASHRRHDLSDQLSDQVWEGLKPHLLGSRVRWVGQPSTTGCFWLFLNAVF